MSEALTEADVVELQKTCVAMPSVLDNRAPTIERLCAAWREQQKEITRLNAIIATHHQPIPE